MSFRYTEENGLEYTPVEYYGVTKVSKGTFQSVINEKGIYWRSKTFNNPRDAAKAYDIKRIELGLKPMNILKKINGRTKGDQKTNP